MGFLYSHPALASSALWLAWAISWVVASAWSSRAQTRISFSAGLGYRALQLIGIGMLSIPELGLFGQWRLWPYLSYGQCWILVALIALGLGFTWWARIHLGRLWSGTITRKSDHHVVDSGPYAIVRHPIYTGLLFAAFATAALAGTAIAFCGALALTASFWIKARIEERFLRTELGLEAYDTYSRKTAMLIPFLKL